MCHLGFHQAMKRKHTEKWMGKMIYQGDIVILEQIWLNCSWIMAALHSMHLAVPLSTLYYPCIQDPLGDTQPPASFGGGESCSYPSLTGSFICVINTTLTSTRPIASSSAGVKAPARVFSASMM